MATPNMSAAELAELEKKIKRIEELSSKFKANINTLNLQPLEENAGAIEAIACAMALKDGQIPPTINTNEIEPEYKGNLFNLLTQIFENTPRETALKLFNSGINNDI